MAKCIHCSCEIKDTAKFCSKCGRSQTPEEKLQIKLVEVIEKPLQPLVAAIPTPTNGHIAVVTLPDIPFQTQTTAATKPTPTPKSRNKEYQSAIKDKKLNIPKKVLDALGIIGDAPITFIVTPDKTVTIKVGKTETAE